MRVCNGHQLNLTTAYHPHKEARLRALCRLALSCCCHSQEQAPATLLHPFSPQGLVVRALVHMHTSQKYPHSVTQGLSLVKQMRNQTAFCLTADVLFLSVIAPACLLCTASNFHRRVWSQTWQCLLGESALLPVAGQLLSSRTCRADFDRGRAARSSPSEGAATIIRTTAVCIRPHLLQRPSDQFQNLACQQC